jgi:hypothetical protein
MTSKEAAGAAFENGLKASGSLGACSSSPPKISAKEATAEDALPVAVEIGPPLSQFEPGMVVALGQGTVPGSLAVPAKRSTRGVHVCCAGCTAVNSLPCSPEAGFESPKKSAKGSSISSFRLACGWSRADSASVKLLGSCQGPPREATGWGGARYAKVVAYVETVHPRYVFSMSGGDSANPRWPQQGPPNGSGHDIAQMFATNPRMLKRAVVAVAMVLIAVFWVPAAIKFYGGTSLRYRTADEPETFVDFLPGKDSRGSNGFMLSRMALPALFERAEQGKSGTASMNLTAADEIVNVDVVAWRKGSMQWLHGPTSSFVSAGQLVFAEFENGGVSRCRTAGAGLIHIAMSLPKDSRYAVICQGASCLEYRTSLHPRGASSSRSLLAISRRSLLSGEHFEGQNTAPSSAQEGRAAASGATTSPGDALNVSRDDVLAGCRAAQERLMRS